MEETLKIIGTSHIAKQSKQDIKKAFSEFQPDIIAVELDPQRLKALTSNEKPTLGIAALKQVGLTGYLFAIIGRFVQRKLGRIVDITPGEEMLLASRIAKKNKLMLALIDQSMHVTLRNVSNKVTRKEKFKMLWDVIASPFSKKMKIDLRKVPKDEFIEKIMEQMKDRYPGLYSALLDDRNRYMADKIKKIQEKYPEKKLLVVVGAGHKKGIIEYLQENSANV